MFGSGTEFSSEDEEKVYGTLPRECLSLFEAPASVVALILVKDYFISSCFFLSCSLLHYISRLPPSPIMCGSLRRLSPYPGSFTLLISYVLLSDCAHSFLFFFPPPPLPSMLPLLHRTILFSFYTSSILPFQHMTDCVINVHHKPLFLLATH